MLLTFSAFTICMEMYRSGYRTAMLIVIQAAPKIHRLMFPTLVVLLGATIAEGTSCAEGPGSAMPWGFALPADTFRRYQVPG